MSCSLTSAERRRRNVRKERASARDVAKLTQFLLITSLTGIKLYTPRHDQESRFEDHLYESNLLIFVRGPYQVVSDYMITNSQM